MNRRTFLAMGVFTLATPTLAHAHAHLVEATPRVGAHVLGPVSAVRIRFTHHLDPARSQLQVFTGAGAEIHHGATIAAEGGVTLVTPLTAPLPPGAYTVRWVAVTRDGHTTHGDFSFTIEQPH